MQNSEVSRTYGPRLIRVWVKRRFRLREFDVRLVIAVDRADTSPIKLKGVCGYDAGLDQPRNNIGVEIMIGYLFGVFGQRSHQSACRECVNAHVHDSAPSF